MTSEDPIPLDQNPMQSWIGVAHSGGLCTLGTMYSSCTVLAPPNLRSYILVINFLFLEIRYYWYKASK